MHQNHLVVRTLWALGIAALLVACSNSGYSETVTPSGVGPGSQTRLAQIGADAVVRFAYAANYDSANVSAYSINATSGKLTPVAGSPFRAGTGPEGVAVDPTGKFAYVANYGSANVSAYIINATSGKLKPVAGSPFGAGTNPTGVAVDPKGKFAYVTNSGSDNVSAYFINASSGKLTPVAGSPFSAGSVPQWVVIDATEVARVPWTLSTLWRRVHQWPRNILVPTPWSSGLSSWSWPARAGAQKSSQPSLNSQIRRSAM